MLINFVAYQCPSTRFIFILTRDLFQLYIVLSILLFVHKIYMLGRRLLIEGLHLIEIIILVCS